MCCEFTQIYNSKFVIKCCNYSIIKNNHYNFIYYFHFFFQIVYALLDVFVGIEMTGQGVDFEQKLNYRRPMYTVMDYLWKLEEHREVFK